MITEGYFGQIKNYPETDVLICVARKYPWFIKKGRMEHAKALAPGTNLLKSWKNGDITWEEYEKHFRATMLHYTVSLGLFRYLGDLAKDKTVRLMCWEKEPPCHRFILLDMFSEFTTKDDKDGLP